MRKLLFLCACACVGSHTVDVVLSIFREPQTCIDETVRTINSSLSGYELRYFLYRKDGLPGSLENLGREGGTYLHHMITHYGDLGDHVLFTQACAHNPDNMQTRLTNEFAITTHSLNLGGAEPGTCDGTVAYPMPRLREIYAMTNHYDFCPDMEFLSYMGGQFIVSKSRIKRHPQKFYEFLDSMLKAPPNHFIHKDIELVRDAGNRDRIRETEQNDNANYFSFQLERAWSIIWDCMRASNSPC